MKTALVAVKVVSILAYKGKKKANYIFKTISTIWIFPAKVPVVPLAWRQRTAKPKLL